jgi:hypothetical protein
MEKEKLHPIDARNRIENNYFYSVEGYLKLGAQQTRLYFDNLLRMGIPTEEICDKIEKITPKGKIKLIDI